MDWDLIEIIAPDLNNITNVDHWSSGKRCNRKRSGVEADLKLTDIILQHGECAIIHLMMNAEMNHC